MEPLVSLAYAQVLVRICNKVARYFLTYLYMHQKFLQWIENFNQSLCLPTNIYARVVIRCSQFVIGKMFIKYSIHCLLLTAFVDMEILKTNSF